MRPLKVLYDFPSFIQTHGGVSRYVCEIIENLEKDIEAEMSILLTDNIYLRNLPFLRSKLIFNNKDYRGKKRIENWVNVIYSNYKVIRDNYDIYHATCADSYPLKNIKKPLVVTIHDLVNEKLSQYHESHAKHIARKKELIYQSAHIITISQNTKKDLLDIYPVNPDKISVIYHGAPHASTVDIKNNFGKYILFVGRRQRYKNFPNFLEATSRLLKENPELKLVCVGPPFNAEEEQNLTRKGIEDRVVVTSVSDDHLYSLYKNALTFVFPSTFEGFGIPILEAFANDCPVCLSNSSCFPEIAGNAGAYFNAEDPQSIYSTVKKVISDKDLSSNLIREGKERLKLFSWKNAARQTLEVYESLR